MVNRERLVSEFIELVHIDSPSFSEGKIASVLLDKLADLGAEVFQDDAASVIGGDSGNLIARFQGSGGKEPVLLNAHMDTVQSTQGIKTVIRDDVICTDGETILGADDKSGIAVILETIRVLKENNIPFPPLEVVFTVAEEHGLRGAAHLNYSILDSKRGFSLDSGDIDQFVISAPSKCILKVVVHGLEAHAGGEPEKGIHAIRIAADAITKMNFGKVNERTTANISSFISDYATNVVPARVTIKGEIRSLDDFTLHAQIDHMIECFLEAAQGCSVIKNSKKIEARIEHKLEHRYSAFTLDQDCDICNISCAAAKQVGISPHFVAGMGGTDANHFNNNGIDVLLIGTGIVDAHSRSENIAVRDMVKSAGLLVEILKSL